jgi:hypothetical protein
VSSELQNILDRLKAEAAKVPKGEKSTADLEKKFYKKSNKEKLKGDKQDREERKIYANLVFTLISIWLIVVVAIFVSCGQGNLKYSDSVLITLLTTTTANVIAIFHFVMKYLFHPKP